MSNTAERVPHHTRIDRHLAARLVRAALVLLVVGIAMGSAVGYGVSWLLKAALGSIEL